MNSLTFESLYLCNFFGVYGTKNYDLSEHHGLIGFIGNNGTNKSNTLLSIPFALYGELPKTNLRDIINTTALLEDPEKCVSEVTLVFTVKRDKYSVSRTINVDEKMTSRLEINDKLFSRKRGEIDDEIVKILGMTLEVAQLTIFSEQGKVDKFFELDNPEKKEFIDRVINVNYKENFEALKKRILFFEKRQDKMVNALSIYASQKKNLQTSITESKDKIITLKEDFKKFNAERLSAVVKELESYSKFEETKSQLESSENQLKDVQSILQGLGNGLLEKDKALKSAQDKLLGVKFNKQKISKEKAPTPINLEDSLAMFETEYSGITAKITKINQDIKLAEKEIAGNTEELSSLNKSLKEDICYVCHKPGIDLKEFNDKVSGINLKQQDLNSRLASSKSDLTITTQDEGRLSVQISSLKEQKKVYDKDLSKYNESATKRASYGSDLKVHRNSKKILTQALTDAKKAKEASFQEFEKKRLEVLPRIEQLGKDIQTYRSALGASPDGYKKLQEEEKTLKDLQVEHGKIIIELAKFETLFNKDQETLVGVTSKIDKISRIKSKIEIKLMDFPILKKHIETKFILFVQKSLSRINSLTNQILKEIGSLIEIRMVLEETAKSSSVKCHYIRDQVEVPRISGGQKVVLGICFRIALWKYLSLTNPGNLSFMILDEVLVQLNADQANAAFNQIKALKKYFKYIFMTSHTDHIWNVDHTFRFE